jgi:hypothetical protein
MMTTQKLRMIMSALELQNAIGDTLLQVVLQQQAQRKRLQQEQPVVNTKPVLAKAA